MKLLGMAAIGGAALAGILAVVIPDWHFPVAGEQIANDGSGNAQFAGTYVALRGVNALVPALPPLEPDSRPATAAYRNVQVLTDVDAGHFMQIQAALTAWVSPQQGCAFCHDGTNFASDAKPEKAVARAMLRMTRHINADWGDHVGAPATAGVTCFTCHRGQPMPPEAWLPSPPFHQHPGIAKQDDWRDNAVSVRGFFPDAGWSEYALQQTPGVVLSETALPTGEVKSGIAVKRLYEYMMQMSDGIGVNCGYCHEQTRAFQDWSQSTPARWVGYSGIQMTRDINRAFILPTWGLIPQSRAITGGAREPILPARESGAQPGNGLAICITCHTGLPQPHGAGLLAAFPGLVGTPSPNPAVHAAAGNPG